jgi:2-succinyl-6-hydroxy-2,4-cyclohexadiene-1-carboxylate synthase
MTITALHGFLGLPTDFNFLRDEFDLVTPPLDAIPPVGDVLLGYSLGGRLALHALLSGARYRKAVIVSAGLGIEGDQARAARRAADEVWAQRFEDDPWDELLRDWNAQAVFGGHALARDERAYSRAALAHALRAWSPAALPPVQARLRELDLPILWITGARDVKYAAEGERAVALLPQGELAVIADAGHRVPWEAPQEFRERLRAFVE